MSKVIELPGGGTATFREKRTGHGKKLMRAAGLSAAGALSDYPELFEDRPGESPEARVARLSTLKVRLSPEQAEFWDNMHQAKVLALLESWTLDLPLPKSGEELEALDEDLYDALIDAVVEIPEAALGETDFSPTKEKLDPTKPLDEQNPTGAFSRSSEPSSESQPSNLMTRPGNDGSPTVGVSSSLVP